MHANTQINLREVDRRKISPVFSKICGDDSDKHRAPTALVGSFSQLYVCHYVYAFDYHARTTDLLPVLGDKYLG